MFETKTFNALQRPLHPRVALGAYSVIMAFMFASAGCGDESESPELVQEDTPVVVTRANIIKDGTPDTPLCRVTMVEGGKKSVVDLEDYVANVVACENGRADFEALKAQAVAVRSYAKANLAAKKAAGKEVVMVSSQKQQVSKCSYFKKDGSDPQWDVVKKAVAETRGQVLVGPDQNAVLHAFYVSGTTKLDSECKPTIKCSNHANQCHVTNNEHKTGSNITRSSLGHRANITNRGCMSQNASNCLSKKGWGYQRILRYYYGADAKIVTIPSCGGEPAPVPKCGLNQPENAHCGVENPNATPVATKPDNCGAEEAPVIHSRSEWGARRPTKARGGLGKVTRITIHHTVTKTRPANPAAAVYQVQGMHMNGNGWSDIGYHFLIDGNGEAWEGNPIDRLGAHVKNNNTGNIGISFLGSYHIDQPTDVQLRGAARLIKKLAREYGLEINSSTIKGHRDHMATECPGKHLYAKLGTIIEYANAKQVCQDPPAAPTEGAGEEQPAVRTKGLKYVKAVVKSGEALFDTVLFTANGNKVYASSSSAGAKAAGEPGITESCDQMSSNGVKVAAGSEITWEFPSYFLPTDSLDFVRDALPFSKRTCSFPDGEFDVYVSENGSDWIQVGQQVTGAPSFQNFAPVSGEFPDFGNGGISGGGSGLGGILGGILGGLNFKIPGLATPGIIGEIGSKIAKIKDVLQNITIGKDFKFSFNVSEKAASLEFYVNGELVQVSYDKENGFSFKADVIKILGLGEVVAVIKDKAGSVIESVKTYLNFSDEEFGFITPQADVVYGPNLHIAVAINNPKVKSVSYEIDKWPLPNSESSDASKNFAFDYVVKNVGSETNPRKATLVATAKDESGNIIGTATTTVLIAKKASGIALVEPKPGATISQKHVFSSDANNPNIKTVEYYVDGNKVASSTNRKSGFSAPVEIKTNESKVVTVKVVAKNEAGDVVAEQSAQVVVSGPNGAVSPSTPEPANPEHTVAPAPDTQLADANQLLAKEAARAWIAGNGCTTETANYWNLTEVKNRKSERKNPAWKGHPRCSGPSSSQCAGSNGRCWSAVKGALTRGKIAGVPGLSCSQTQHTIRNEIDSFSKKSGLNPGHIQLSAFQFANMAAKPGFTNKFGFTDITSELSAPKDAPIGSIIVWDRGCTYVGGRGYFHKTYGHIEIVAADGVACSDYCSNIVKPKNTNNKCWHVYKRTAL